MEPILLLIAVGAGVIVSALRRGGASPIGSVSTYKRAIIHPKIPSPQRGARIREVAEALKRAWPKITGGGTMPESALQIALAQCGLETGGGFNWSADGGLGGRHCGRGDKGSPGLWDCVPRKDSRPATPAEIASGSPSQVVYEVNLRKYLSIDAAAEGFLRDITKQWPAMPELVSGDGLAYCRRQRINGYYGGFNVTPKDAARWADTIQRLAKMGGLPTKQSETQEVLAGRVAVYCSALGRWLPEIVGALGTSPKAYVPADLVGQ